MSLARSAALAALLGLIAAPAVAQKGWSAVGRAKIDSEAATGTLEVKWQPGYREIMLCAEGNAVKLDTLVLQFRDGKSQPVKLRARLADGGCSKTASVARNRDVATADISYDRASLAGGKTRLQLYAR
jgi:hypothetical protein